LPENPEQIAARIYCPSAGEGSLRQGEILSNVIQSHLKLESIFDDSPTIQNRVHQYAIILTQDCDLAQDLASIDSAKGRDKLLPTILFCELKPAQSIRWGDATREAIVNSKIWTDIEQNKNERFHFFQKIPANCNATDVELPELVADFKRYFAIPAREVYARLHEGEMIRCCKLNSPYLEHFSTRFAYFQFRIALPEQHFSEASTGPPKTTPPQPEPMQRKAIAEAREVF